MQGFSFRRRPAVPGLVLLAGALFAAPAAAQQPAAQQATPAQRAAARACMPDVRAHCAGVQRGEGRILACLQQNRERVSQPCREAMAAGRSVPVQ